MSPPNTTMELSSGDVENSVANADALGPIIAVGIHHFLTLGVTATILRLSDVGGLDVGRTAVVAAIGLRADNRTDS